MADKDYNILIVEDNSTMRKILEVTIIALGYNRPLTAINGLKGWEAIRQEKIDLVLCDYMMPEMNGVELLRLVRKSKQFYNLPFIIVSGADQRGDFMKTLQAEVDFYIIKPPNKQILGDVVKQALLTRKHPTDYIKAMNKGKYHYLNKDYPKALEQFTFASKARNDLALPYYYLGLTFQQLKH